MPKSTSDIMNILGAGGGVIIDSTKSTSDLMTIVGSSKIGTTVIIRNASIKSTSDLMSIAGMARGKGSVIFEL